MAAQPESLRYRQLLKVLNKALDASVDADQTLPVIHGCFRGLPKSGKARFDLLCRSMLRELRKNIESEFRVISEHQDLPGLLLELDRQAGLAEEESAAAAESTVTATAATGAVAVALCEARTRIKESEVERLGEILAEMRSGNEAALAEVTAQRAAASDAMRRVAERGRALREAASAAS